MVFEMTIYWETCSLCFRHDPVKQCGLVSDVMVCIHCCISCIKREVCPRKAWVLETGERVVKKSLKEEVEKFLEEIEFLSSKSGGKSSGKS